MRDVEGGVESKIFLLHQLIEFEIGDFVEVALNSVEKGRKNACNHKNKQKRC